MRKAVVIAVLGMLLLASCSETKYVAEDEYLLDRVKVKSDRKSRHLNISELKSYIRQRGNSRWFSAVKLPLRTYSLSGRDTSKWINRALRSIGEPPQLYDSAQTLQSQMNLQMQLQNMGFLRATVDVRNDIKGRKLITNYLLHPGQPYFIRHLRFDIQDSLIARIPDIYDPSYVTLRRGMLFNAANLDNERVRITKMLTNHGYYRFNKDFITYRADSIENTPYVDLTLVLHRFRNNEVTDTLHQQYTIGKIQYRNGNAEDSVIRLRPSVLRANTFLEEDALYSAEGLQSTYNHFGRLGAVRYTNIAFRERPQQPVLDCDISVSTNKPSTISFQPEGTNTAGDLGAAATLTYQNRNIFHGSENLTIELRGAYEAIKGLEGYSNHDFLEYSVESRLTFPRFIAPFLARSFRRRINATSEVSLLYDLQNRPEFHRRVFSVAWRYKWNDQRHHDRYQIDLLDLNYISMPWISETFREQYLDDTSSRNAILRYNYENLFIMKFGVGYTYNNGRIAIKAKAESAGNLLNLASNVFGFHRNEEGQNTFLDIAYAQYVKGDIDFTRNVQLAYNSQLVFHVGLGIAYPYGNSTILPFEKRYFSGGANSVRGWSVRSLGPGKFVGTDGRIDFINQTGDMKLDLNLEYRAHLFWKFGAALFVDAGNIWTLRNYPEQPGGQFRFTEFWRQLAASYGLGLRLNFDYFIVRFDMGMKAVNPAYETHREHFPLLYPKLSRDFAFHFAVGLPF
jgi:outer membrane protein assembly factor BamA